MICPLLCVSVSDAEGQMRVTEVATRPLSQDLLNHDVSFFFLLWPLFDSFSSKILTLYQSQVTLQAVENTAIIRDGAGMSCV